MPDEYSHLGIDIWWPDRITTSLVLGNLLVRSNSADVDVRLHSTGTGQQRVKDKY